MKNPIREEILKLRVDSRINYQDALDDVFAVLDRYEVAAEMLLTELPQSKIISGTFEDQDSSFWLTIGSNKGRYKPGDHITILREKQE